MTDPGPAIDPVQLATALAVFRRLDDLPVDHPDAVAVRRATARLFKTVKERRRKDRHELRTVADQVLTSTTATAAPDRIDDETRGLPLGAGASGLAGVPGVAGTLHRARACYVCKERYRQVHTFYHQLCPNCAEDNWARREARADLSGRRALLTGGRAKIGMHVALRLLRDGAHTTITTRFPGDAVRRFRSMPDSDDWLDRLRIVGVDLRDPQQVMQLADEVAAAGPLDVLINNAAQTVRRTPGSYAQLIAAEAAMLPPDSGPEVVHLGSGPAALTGGSSERASFEAHNLTALALTTGSASLERVAAGTAIDAGGLVPDLDAINSWTRRVHEVDALELLEVQLCNVTAPFVLVSRLRPALAAAVAAGARRSCVVNVSAMEGQFGGRRYKGAGHPHTNMAKAALNMLTRTAAADMATEGILMTSVDTGWITDERPHPTKARLADEGFHAPLDLVDGAARIYDPIVRAQQGEDVFGVFLKDYHPVPW